MVNSRKPTKGHNFVFFKFTLRTIRYLLISENPAHTHVVTLIGVAALVALHGVARVAFALEAVAQIYALRVGRALSPNRALVLVAIRHTFTLKTMSFDTAILPTKIIFLGIIV